MKENGSTANLKKVEEGKTAGKAKAKAKEPSLTDRIKFYNELAETVQLRGRYQQTREDLEAEPVRKDAEFTSDRDYDGTLKFMFVNGQGHKVVSISQPELVHEMRAFVIGKVNSKIQELDRRILA